MTLNKYTMTGEEIEGVRLLEFRGTQWLSSTCIRAGVIMLARRYVSIGVGNFMPDWYPDEGLDRQKKAAATHGAFYESVQRQIGVVNTGGFHWVAFFIDLTSTPARCTMFDPQQTASGYNALEKAIQSVIVPQLRGHPEVKFTRWVKCRQTDGHSCGLWSLFFLESLLSGNEWSDSSYKLEQYYRLRYLRLCAHDSENTNGMRTRKDC